MSQAWKEDKIKALFVMDMYVDVDRSLAAHQRRLAALRKQRLVKAST
jgi:hypothetical protein